MTPEKLAWINLITQVGLDMAMIIWKTTNSAATIDDAISALEKSRDKTWEDYKREAATRT